MDAPQLFEGDRFGIEVAADGLTATVLISAGAEVSTGAVISKLKEIGIASFDDGDLIQALDDRNGAGIAFVASQGVAPVEGRAGKIDFRVPLASSEQGLVAKVIEGQVIATVGPGAPGTDGCDVYGKTIPCKVRDALQPGPGTALVKGCLTATTAGNAAATEGLVSVRPLFEASANDDLLRLPLNFNGDVALKSSLPEGRTLKISGCLIVGGTIEAADFNVGQWMHVKGGIVGREKKAGFVGGDLWCRFISRAHLSVRGDIHIQNELLNSYVACTGKLTLARGHICGGFVMANGGVDCRALGNASGVPTVVEAGTDHTLRTMLGEAKSEMEANRIRATQIRQKIAPLMAHLKTLTAQQKEKATELLYEADELEEAIKTKRANLLDPCRVSAERSRPEIAFAETIFPGVTLRFPGVETLVNTSIEGPAKIVSRKSGNLSEIIIEEQDGTICLLPSIQTVDGFNVHVERLIGVKKAA